MNTSDATADASGGQQPARLKPLLIFDGQCGFCRMWIERWRSTAGHAVDFAPFQVVADAYPDIPEHEFRRAVHLVQPDGTLTHAAEAVFQMRAIGGRGAAWWAYRELPGVAPTSEFGYRCVAAARTPLFWMTRALWGSNLQPATYMGSRWLFMRLLGVVYGIAFLSWWVQLDGLAGSNGITPAARTLEFYQQRLTPQTVWDYVSQVPSVLWFDCSDRTLHALCAAGVVLSGLVVVRVCVAPALLLLWVLYLSLCAADAVFLGFQWENLLLEAGFIAIFWAPWRPWPRLATDRDPGWAARWLLRWLLFRLMLSSGVVKLLSGDDVWLNYTALQYHYWTQCIPTPLAWYFHQLPSWFQAFSCQAMFVIEIGAPFLIFAPRRPRMFAGMLMIGLMAGIAVTGNYNYFNLLTAVLCIPLFDDAALRWRRREPQTTSNTARAHPGTLASGPPAVADYALRQPGTRSALRIVWIGTAGSVKLTLVVALAAAGGVQMWQRWDRLIKPGRTFLGQEFKSVPQSVVNQLQHVRPFRSVNSYGLFTNMTETRPELIVEGSADGREWQAYAFKYKAGDLLRAPPWVAPHQPRLDWQMWFEALRAERILAIDRPGARRPRPSGWFQQFLSRLLQGEPAVLALLEGNPFPDEPPRFIRVQLYQYTFTSRREKADTGAWWKRQYVGTYTSLRRTE